MAIYNTISIAHTVNKFSGFWTAALKQLLMYILYKYSMYSWLFKCSWLKVQDYVTNGFTYTHYTVQKHTVLQFLAYRNVLQPAFYGAKPSRVAEQNFLGRAAPALLLIKKQFSEKIFVILSYEVGYTFIILIFFLG